MVVLLLPVFEHVFPERCASRRQGSAAHSASETLRSPPCLVSASKKGVGEDAAKERSRQHWHQGCMDLIVKHLGLKGGGGYDSDGESEPDVYAPSTTPRFFTAPSHADSRAHAAHPRSGRPPRAGRACPTPRGTSGTCSPG